MRNKKPYHTAVITSYFPSTSETFVVNHITGLIDDGFNVTILARKKEPISKSSQKDIFLKYGLLEKTVQIFPDAADGKLEKLKIVISWFLLSKFNKPKELFNFLRSTSLERTKWLKNRRAEKAFSPVSNLDFYHAHFGNNGLHLSNLHREDC